jgi:3',5'-cyclic AMP phosphodiesterase CpdA
MKRILCTLVVLLAWFSAWAGLEPSKSGTRIAFLSDTHVSLRTNESGVLYNAHLNAAIAAVNTAKVDLVLIAGDLTDNGQPEQMALFKKLAGQIKAPVLFVAGNHDVGHAGNADKPITITPKRVKLFSQKLGPNWFAVEKAGVRIIGVNSCLFETGFKEEKEQWKFLEKELASRRSEPVLLLEHYPLFLKAADEPANGVWNVHPEPRKRLMALLKQGGVRAALSGHMHRPIVNRLDGILFLGNGATAYGIPRGKQEAGWMLLSVPREGEVQFEFKPLK